MCRLLFLLLFTRFTGTLAGQPAAITGCIKSSATQEPVPFAAVVFGKNGTLSDINGYFTLPVAGAMHDSVIFSSLGYSRKARVMGTLTDTPFTVYLTPLPCLLDTFTVTGLTAKALVQAAIKKIPENYPRDSFVLPVFYRQYHKENGRYVRLIEAQIDLFDKGYSQPRSKDLRTLFYVKALRRSDVAEQNAETHGDHLVDLLMQNPVKFATGSVLNPVALDNWVFTYDTSWNERTSQSHCILFRSRPNAESRIRNGKMLINKETLAFEKIITESRIHPRFSAPSENDRYTWLFLNGVSTVEFESHNGKMHLRKMTHSYAHDLYNNRFRNMDYRVEEYFELYAAEPQNSPSVPLKSFERVVDLYLVKYRYDSSLFHPDSLPPFSGYGPLSVKRPMEQQYSENGQP